MKISLECYLLTALTALGLGVVQGAQSQGCGSDARALWQQGDYTQAVPLLRDCLNQPYGREPEVFYMLGVSYCELGQQQYGKCCLRWLLERFDLPTQTRRIVDSLVADCGTSLSVTASLRVTGVTISAGVSWVGAGSHGETKSFYNVEDPLRRSFVDSLVVVHNVAESELHGRLRNIADGPTPPDSIVAAFPAHPNVQYSPHFRFIDFRNLYVDATRRELYFETMMQCFVRLYKVPLPEHYISVYIAPDSRQFQDIALKVHGLAFPARTLGYSFQDDASVVGITGGEQSSYGTLMHELCHLLVRTNFGDIPPWLDEGLAALYEVSERVGSDSLLGGRNPWRENVLSKYWAVRAPLSELVTMDWPKFKGDADSTGIRQAVNEAEARYFMFYLQEIGKLSAVYSTIQAMQVSSSQNFDSLNQLQASAISTVVGQSMPQVDSSFASWYSTLTGFETSDPTSKSMER